MKKLSIKQVLRIKNINNKKRKLSKKNHRISRTKRKIESINFSGKMSLFVDTERVKIVNLVQAIESNLSKKYYLDFSKLEILNPSTALYVKQYLDRYPDVRFQSKSPKAILPRATFKLLGFNKNFSLKNIDKYKYNTHVDDWNVCCGENCDLPQSTLQHLSDIKLIFEDKNVSFKLTNAIMEAITNVIHHAYQDQNSNYKKWFLLTHVSKDNKNVSVVVSDLGASVPYTTPETVAEKFQYILAYDIPEYFNLKSNKKINNAEDLRGFNDSRLIKIATKLKSTRTNLENRGKGFNDILDLVNNVKDYKEIKSVTTSVLSRSGSYVYTAGPDGYSRERSYTDGLEDFKNQIKGTVISWTIQLF